MLHLHLPANLRCLCNYCRLQQTPRCSVSLFWMLGLSFFLLSRFCCLCFCLCLFPLFLSLSISLCSSLCVFIIFFSSSCFLFFFSPQCFLTLRCFCSLKISTCWLVQHHESWVQQFLRSQLFHASPVVILAFCFSYSLVVSDCLSFSVVHLLLLVVFCLFELFFIIFAHRCVCDFNLARCSSCPWQRWRW